VNTGAISRGYRTEPYPEDSLLDKIAQSGKPLVVNSDTHNTGTLAFLIGETKEKLDKKGYKYIDSLDEIL
jgi:histidinol-phosphatase (PHP family)